MKSETEIVAEIERRIERCEIHEAESLDRDFHKSANVWGDRKLMLQSLRDWITSDDAADAGKGEVKP